MSLLTTWGYTLKNADSLIDMITSAEFDELTADKYRGDQRTAPNIRAASTAVRNYCGWHVYPSLECELSTTLYSGRITRTGKDALVQLPAKYVSAVTSVKIGGKDYTAYSADPSGLLKIYDIDWHGLKEYSDLKIEYVAGLPAGLMDSIKELIAHRITHALASSGGVQSETAGGVSITYSANWINSARSTALADDNKEVLAPYKIQGVF